MYIHENTNNCNITITSRYFSVRLSKSAADQEFIHFISTRAKNPYWDSEVFDSKGYWIIGGELQGLNEFLQFCEQHSISYSVRPCTYAPEQYIQLSLFPDEASLSEYIQLTLFPDDTESF